MSKRVATSHARAASLSTVFTTAASVRPRSMSAGYSAKVLPRRPSRMAGRLGHEACHTSGGGVLSPGGYVTFHIRPRPAGFLISALAALFLTACGGYSSPTSPSPGPAPTPAPAPQPSPTPAPAPTPAPTPTPAPAPT